MTEPTSAQELFKGRHFDQEIIVLCVRWYLTFKLPADVCSGSMFFQVLLKSLPQSVLAPWSAVLIAVGA